VNTGNVSVVGGLSFCEDRGASADAIKFNPQCLYFGGSFFYM
jgi:hypothetical protein